MRHQRVMTAIVTVLGSCLALLLTLTAEAAPGATITVTTVADTVADDGACSLREAITAANTDAAVGGCAAGNGADVIEFNIDGGGATQTVQPATELPPITTSMTLDATTQGCAGPNRCVELDGSLLPASSFNFGLGIAADNVTVRGFAINRFPGNGITVSGGSNNLFDQLFVGTDVSGTEDQGNGRNAVGSFAGILLTSGSNNNRIVDSLLSGNNDSGVSVRNGDGNRIESSILGVDRTGATALPNDGYGVAAGLGGPTDMANNTVITGSLLSGNGFNGVRIFAGSGLQITNSTIGTNQDGTAALPNGSGSLDSGGVHVGESTDAIIRGNLIAGNNGNGILGGGSGHMITGNTIGANRAGADALPNDGRGIEILGDGVVVGSSESGNLIGGHPLEAIRILGDNTRVENNAVGLNGAENSALPNGGDLSGSGSAVMLSSGSNFVVLNNRISGNAVSGLGILDGSGHRVEGNTIGLNGAGDAAIANDGDGVRMGGDGSVIRDNVVSGNSQDGIVVLAGANGATITGNTIGVNAGGTAAIGNGRDGLNVLANDATIGGTAGGDANVIGGNTRAGIILGGNGGGHEILGNVIGAGAGATTPIGNGDAGILISQSDGNTIRGNVITANGAAGIVSEPFGNTGNAILGNRIFANSGLGIDLDDDGVTANDADDSDAGSNDLQNFPVIDSAVSDGITTTITGTLTSTVSTEFRVEVFANDECDDSDHGEGQRFLGFVEVTSDASGAGDFAIPVPASEAPPEVFITATATDPDGNTSEFSQCVEATGEPPIVYPLYLPFVKR